MSKSEFQQRHIKNLEWAILLSRTNLDGCTEGDWLNLKEGLYDFIYWMAESREVVIKQIGGGKKDLVKIRPTKGVIFPPMPRSTFFDYVSKEGLMKLRANFQLFFENVARGIVVYKCQIRDVSFWISANKPTGHFIRYIILGPSQMEEQYIPVAQISLGDHLTESGIMPDQIRLCPECNRLFMLKMRPRKDRNFYCSLMCTRNAATRAYRKRKAEELKLKEGERSHRRYKQRVRQQPGHARSKVVRRPRKPRVT